MHYEDDAKEKYNEDTVSINGSDPSAPVQVTIDPDNTKANDIIDPDIRIEDSYKIKSPVSYTHLAATKNLDFIEVFCYI